MFVCVDAKWVGVNASDQVPSLPGVTVPRSDPESRSPSIHTSMRSMSDGAAPGADTVPMMVWSPLRVETFWFSDGSATVTWGAPVAALATVAAAVVLAAVAPVALTLTVIGSYHHPLAGVCTYTSSVCGPAGMDVLGTLAKKPDADQ